MGRQTPELDSAILRVSAWIRDYGDQKEPAFIADCTTLIKAANEVERLRAGPAQHDGDCTIYASPVDRHPEYGICTCGYGWRCVRKGNWSKMYSREREAAEAD